MGWYEILLVVRSVLLDVTATHMFAAISSAIVRADALLVRNAAASLAFQLAHAPGPS